jgi:preprotein translocase subunit SecD
MQRPRSSRYGKAGLSGLFLLSLTVLVGAQPLTIAVQDAATGTDQRSGETIVQLKMQKESGLAFAGFTQRHLGKPMEIRVDGRTVSKPVIREPILGGSLQISGQFSPDEAADLARRISAGTEVVVEAVD